MIISFATCDPSIAARFIRHEHNRELTDADLAPLMKLVAADIVRVTDPDYHTCAIVRGTNWNDSHQAELTEAIKPLATYPAAGQERSE